VFDAADLSAAVQRQFVRPDAEHQGSALDAGWDLGGGSRFDFGGDYRTTDTRQTQVNTRQVLGDWNNALPPDVERLRPGPCPAILPGLPVPPQQCDGGSAGLVAWRAQDTTKLYNALYNHYIGIT
jgi:hypothetical protein